MSHKKLNITYCGIDFDDFELFQRAILHDLNSLNTFVTGYADIIRTDLENDYDSSSEDFLELVLNLDISIDRMASICNEIKALTQNIQVDED